MGRADDGDSEERMSRTGCSLSLGAEEAETRECLRGRKSHGPRSSLPALWAALFKNCNTSSGGNRTGAPGQLSLEEGGQCP